MAQGFAPPTFAHNGGMDDWVWFAARFVHEPWTLWTAAVVHFSAAHALANGLALLALLLLARVWWLDGHLGWRSALAVFLAWPLGVLLLLLWPQVSSYRGLSGPLHALAAVLVVHTLVRGWLGERRLVWGALALGLGLALKLALERAWALPLVADAQAGFVVARAAHLSGALAGLVCALLTLVGWRGKQVKRVLPPQ